MSFSRTRRMKTGKSDQSRKLLQIFLDLLWCYLPYHKLMRLIYLTYPITSYLSLPYLKHAQSTYISLQVWAKSSNMQPVL